MARIDDLRRLKMEVAAQITRAGNQGRPHVEINAGELHRIVFPGVPTHQIPMSCSAMREARADTDAIVFGPVEGDGASLTIRYTLPRLEVRPDPPAQPVRTFRISPPTPRS